MEKQSKYAPKQKLEIVLEGLRAGTNITELCRRHQINSTLYYKWRDLFIRKGEEIFTNKGNFASERLYLDKIRQMERIIGRQAMEIEILKKTEDYFNRI